MPPVLPPVNEAVFAQIGGLNDRMRALETQQQMTLSNLQGQPVLNFGLSPGSNPAQYGLQAVNPSTGTEIGFWGEDSGGNAALKFRNGSGVVQAQFDVNGLHIYDGSGNQRILIDVNGLHQYDASGNQIALFGTQADGNNALSIFNASAQEEARLGKLHASPDIYGVAVAPSTGSAPGTLQQVGGSIAGATCSASNVTSTSWNGFTSPTGSVTAEVGPSGLALISLVGHIATGASGEIGELGVIIDAAASPTGPPIQVSASQGTGGVQMSGGVTFVASGLSTTTHTFQPAWTTANNGASTCSFSNVQVFVQPL